MTKREIPVAERPVRAAFGAFERANAYGRRRVIEAAELATKHRYIEATTQLARIAKKLRVEADEIDRQIGKMERMTSPDPIIRGVAQLEASGGFKSYGELTYDQKKAMVREALIRGGRPTELSIIGTETGRFSSSAPNESAKPQEG